ncbi:MAG: glutamate 5-kinase [Acidimicrobiales bacterium]|nr:glutamate 5-kinase [Acidimicrobiales bacterium]
MVVKIGTSSLTDESGQVVDGSIAKLCAEVAAVRAEGARVVVVTSAAIAAGLPELGMGHARPTDAVTLQAVSAVGQIRLVQRYQHHFAEHGLVAGQVLLAPLDFSVRSQYLHARATLARLLELGVVPVVNENDAIADDEIRFGDNDRLAALVAHLVDAELLVLLTDTDGVLTADPRVDSEASLIEEIVEFDAQLESAAGGSGTPRGSGGMSSKLVAAKIASWTGVRSVIASASRPDVIGAAWRGDAGVGTQVRARDAKLSAWRLWIAFAISSAGIVSVDAGARAALERGGTSLLSAGVTGTSGTFGPGDAVEIADADGTVFAKGLVRVAAANAADWAGKRSADLPAGVAAVVVHADDLVLLP